MLQSDLLQGHEVLCQLAAPLEDGGIGTLGQNIPGQPQEDPVPALFPVTPFTCLLGLGFKLGTLLALSKLLAPRTAFS